MQSLPDPRVSGKREDFHHCNVEVFRQRFESDKQWSARRQFIVKHLEECEEHGQNKLLALSMVWVNHVFMGCRYGSQLMDKVLEMAKGIDVGDITSYELVPNAEPKKRPHSLDGAEEPMRKIPASKFKARPRFEPIHFVVGGSSGSEQGRSHGEESVSDRKKEETVRQRTKDLQLGPANHGGVSFPSASHETKRHNVASWPQHGGNEVSSESTCEVGFGSRGYPSKFMCKMQQEYTAKYERHAFKQSDSFQLSSREDCHEKSGQPGNWSSGLRFEHQKNFSNESSTSRGSCRGGSSLLPKPSHQSSIRPEIVHEKQCLISRVSSNLLISFRDPMFRIGPESINYNFLLNRCIQSCKLNPEYIYVNLKDLGSADLPKNRKLPSEGYACELRCHGVYLATGYSGSKNGARDRASEQAVKLFLNPVEVRVIQRLYRHKYVQDLVVCQMNNPNPGLPPPLRNPEEKQPPRSKVSNKPDHNKQWSQFILLDNAFDNICILNNSAAHSRMKIDYTFDPVPNSSLWVCGVYLQGELVAQATGSKKASKHLAAGEAVKRLRAFQEAHKQEQPQQHFSEGSYSSNRNSGYNDYQRNGLHLGKLVILENSHNSICVINDTAQFNKVNASYKFMAMPDHNWRCDVFLDDQFVASGVGPKKTVKSIAAMEAIAALKRTHAVVKSTLLKEGNVDSISREEIVGHSKEESLEQVIKEDNIGNQLLRKMGWTGGGLGREGEGIVEPIEVEKNFNRGGVGLNMEKQGNQITSGDFEKMIRSFATSDRQDNLRFTTELNMEERKQIHHISQKYGLRSKSYGRGRQRFLVVSRKVKKEHLIGQLLQVGQVGQYELVKPQGSF